MEDKAKEPSRHFSIINFIKSLGPGVITGAADDDPSGIATYSQTGAQFGYSQLWMVLFLYPLMTAVQEACARIGAVTSKGIAQIIRENYSKHILYGAVGLIFVANTINIGADIGAMAASTALIIPLPFAAIMIFFTLVTLLLEIFLPYKKYAKILKWLTISLFVYPVTLFLVEQPWGELLTATFLPHIQLNAEFLFVLVAVIGTTISPYMFFWQASEEVEEKREQRIATSDGGFKKFLRTMRIDNAFGMFLSQAITWCIIVVTGTVLHRAGVTNIASAADAAKALEPLVHTFPNAGFLAQLLFAVGIVGLGLLAIPVLAASSAYAVAEACTWNEGLDRKIGTARGFYAIIIIATVVGLLINFVGINPIRALIVTSVINAIASIPLIFLIIKISSNKNIMGEYASGRLSKIVLWITFGGTLLAAGGLVLPLIF